MVEKEEILEALKNVYDPEIPVNIVDLGLIYDVNIDKEKNIVKIKMTFTTPDCPVGKYILSDVETVVKSFECVKDVKIELTFDPLWKPDMMSEDAKKMLGYE